MASNSDKDLRAEARSFCDSLGNVFMMKRRDPQTHHLLEKSKHLLESLLQEHKAKSERRPAIPPKPTRGSSTGQLWVKLDELKRENDELRKKMNMKKDVDKAAMGKSVGPGDVIISELNKYKQENEDLKTRLEKSITAVKELENINLTLQDEFKRTKIAQEVAHDSLEKIREEQKTLESSLTTAKKENDSLKMRLTHSVKPMKRLDARLVENINERCRPSTVAQLYDRLESNEWVDAKEALEEAGYDNEQETTHFLSDVLMMSYMVNMDVISDVESGISEIISQPLKLLDTHFLSCEPAQCELPEDIACSVKDFLRLNVQDVDLQPSVSKCKEKIASSMSWSQFEGLLSHKSIHNYMEQCARVTWQMVCQQTPMWLNNVDNVYNEDMHKLWWSCDNQRDAAITYFVWPSLYDSKNGNLLVKGCVFTEPQS